jgi:hypothetical protein
VKFQNLLIILNVDIYVVLMAYAKLIIQSEIIDIGDVSVMQVILEHIVLFQYVQDYAIIMEFVPIIKFVLVFLEKLVVNAK